MKTNNFSRCSWNRWCVVQTRIRILFILGIFLISALGNTALMGKTLSVPETSPNIKAAMEQAKAGDIILVSCGTYFEHDIIVKPGVSLWSGTLQPSCVTIDAQGKGRGLVFANADSTTSIVGFTIIGGLANPEDHWGQGGGILCVKSNPRISNCIIKSNHAKIGGGIFAGKDSQLNLNNCRIEKNTASDSGGGLAFHGENGIINNCHFQSNYAMSGAGIAIKDATSLQIMDSLLLQNIAGNSGGGILLVGASCEVESTVFSGNVGGLGGGGLAAFNSNPRLSRCTFYGNNSEKEGCALACADSEVEIINSQLTFHPGPLLCSNGSVPLFSGCNLYGNSGGDWSSPLAGQAYKRHNISAPPLFCGAENGDFHLSSNSTCLPDNNPAGNRNIIGAYGIGCSMVAGTETKNNQLADGGP